MVSSRLVASIKARTETFLTETCTIERQDRIRGVYGEQKQDAWVTVAENVKCRVITIGQQQRNSAQQVSDQEALVDLYRLVLPAGTAISVDYRVTVDGRVYQVLTVQDARTDETDVQAVVSRRR